MPQNLGQLCRWALLSYVIAERSHHGHVCFCQQWIIVAVFHSLPFPAPFHHSVVQQTIVNNLIVKFTWRPNMLGTIVLVSIQPRNHFMQNWQQTVHGTHTHTKHETYNNIVVSCLFNCALFGCKPFLVLKTKGFQVSQFIGQLNYNYIINIMDARHWRCYCNWNEYAYDSIRNTVSVHFLLQTAPFKQWK